MGVLVSEGMPKRGISTDTGVKRPAWAGTGASAASVNPAAAYLNVKEFGTTEGDAEDEGP